MNPNLVANFVNSLITRTLTEDIKWHSLKTVSEIDNVLISDWLSEDEFHMIHYHESFFCTVNQGRIFLVSERTESGRDGSVGEGYNLYLQPEHNQPLSCVSFDENELYRLKNAIELKMDLTEDVVDFMKSFLEGQS